MLSCNATHSSDEPCSQLSEDGLPTLAFPPQPDYADTTMWYIAIRDTARSAADIFYVCSTETRQWVDAATGDTILYADPSRPEQHEAMLSEMYGVDRLLCQSGCDFYAPQYRQVTMDGLINDTTQFIQRTFTATADAVRAFNYYLAHRDAGRPFVLMGYSQGAAAVVYMLRRMPDDVARQMVAAYVIGYQVTASDLAYPHIKPATGATDTGVTICFNSVTGVESRINIISGDAAIGINPANWRTDDIPATLCDTLTARLDTTYHLVCISGYDGEVRQIPYYGRRGNFHTQEMTLYATQLAQNIADRVSAWRSKNR